MDTSPDVVITPAQLGQVISVSKGQVIAVTNPGVSMQWQLSYSDTVLELLTPQEKVREPGPDGWLFRAAASGKTDLQLTSIPIACSSNTPCPPMSAKFVFTIQVE